MPSAVVIARLGASVRARCVGHHKRRNCLSGDFEAALHRAYRSAPIPLCNVAYGSKADKPSRAKIQLCPLWSKSGQPALHRAYRQH
jgi:hypothetical protein